MRKDWDYVSFANYEKDMAEISDMAVVTTEHYRREIKAREAVIWAMVKAAGGRIEIYENDLLDRVPDDWEIRSDPANGTRIFIMRDR